MPSLLFAAHRRHVPFELARRQTSTSVDHLKPRAAAVGRKIDANGCTVFPIDAACSGFCRILRIFKTASPSSSSSPGISTSTVLTRVGTVSRPERRRKSAAAVSPANQNEQGLRAMFLPWHKLEPSAECGQPLHSAHLWSLSSHSLNPGAGSVRQSSVFSARAR